MTAELAVPEDAFTDLQVVQTKESEKQDQIFEVNKADFLVEYRFARDQYLFPDVQPYDESPKTAVYAKD